MPPLTPLAELLADARIAGLVAVPTPALLIDLPAMEAAAATGKCGVEPR